MRGVQPAMAKASSRISALRMWVIYLEIGVVLVLVLFIVWWTWPKNRDKDGRDGGQ
jgi:hypothetical protein